MRSKILRLAIACATFVAGISVGAIYRYVRQQRLLAQAHQAAAVAVPSPASIPSSEYQEPCPGYPESLDTTPRDIADFIDSHSTADLTRLWQRLGITDDDFPITHFNLRDPCGSSKAHLFRYNLDEDLETEFVLQIKHQFVESYTYLVFNDTKFLGTIDVYAKYTPADPAVMVSNGRAWLIVQGTAATGSGLSAWLDTVYEVSNRGVRRVGSYLARVNQSGELSFPSKSFVGRPLSCEIKHGRAILELSYTVEYSTFGSEPIELFTKKQTAVLVQSLNNDSSFIEDAQSEITPHEFETIYNFDSMGPEEFLQYNRAELRAIATGNDSEKKKWLKEFLEAHGNGAIKRELLALID